MPNSLEILAKQFEEEKKSGQVKTTKERIEETYKKAKHEIGNRINGYGEKIAPSLEDIAKLEALKEKMLKEVSEVKGTWEKLKEGVSSTTESVLKAFGIERSSERHQEFERARTAALAKTDPTAQNAAIPDYEGYSFKSRDLGTPEEKMEDENFNNPTHWTLTGYLAALQRQNPTMAEAELAKAKNIYDQSSGGYFDLKFDRSFDYQHLMVDMNLQGYIRDLGKYNFSAETNGFAVAYLRVSETSYPSENLAYKQYFFKKLDELKVAGKLDYKAPSNEPVTMHEYNKASFEIKALEEMMDPKEFSNALKPSKERFVKLQQAGATLSSSLSMSFKDPAIVAFLAKKPESFTEADANSLDDVQNKMRGEALNVFAAKVNTVRTKQIEIKAAAGKLGNESGQRLDQKELSDFRELVNNNEKELAEMKVAPAVTFEELIDKSSKLDGIAQRVNLAETTLQNLQKRVTEDAPKKTKEEKKTEKPKDKEKPSEELADNYEKHWHTAVPAESRFMKPHVEVAPGVPQTPLRHPNTGKIIMQIPSLEDLTIVDVRALAKKVDDTVFVKVAYEKAGKKFIGYVEEAVLRYSDRIPDRPIQREPKIPQLEEDRAPLSRFKRKGLEVPAELGWLGYTYLEYVDVLKQLDTYGKNMERYPDGLSFDLRINTDTIPCRMTYDPSGYRFTYGSKQMRYARLEDFMRELNSGELHQKITYEALTDKKLYTAAVEKKIGSVRGIEKKSRYAAEMELEWNGSNPEIHFEVLAHGRINYSIVRDNVGFYGKDVRSGLADNGKDWMTILAHDRKWAEGPKHGSGESLDSKKEILFSAIVNPLSYRNHTFQEEAGRVVGFKLLPHEVVSMYLDWGGGNTMNSKVNALLKVGVEKDGMLWFSVDNAGLGAKGVGPERVKDFAAMMERVKELRKRAGGETVIENRASIG